MYEMIDGAQRVTSISLLVGRGACNARCEHCAGSMHRSGAPRADGVIDETLVATVLRKCHSKGARSLSISSSGEPTISPRSVTQVLMIADMLRKEGADYPSVHLYTNGIRVGKDEAFARRYLPLWKSLGLETLYVTVHDVDPVRNARIYGVKKYPDLETIVRRIHAAGLKVRANMVLAKTTTHTLEVFVHMVTELQSIGFDAVTAWPIRGDDDRIDRSLAPPEVELMRMSSWTQRHTRPHAPVRLLLDSDRMAYESGQKLTLFPNGTVSNKWCP